VGGSWEGRKKVLDPICFFRVLDANQSQTDASNGFQKRTWWLSLREWRAFTRDAIARRKLSYKQFSRLGLFSKKVYQYYDRKCESRKCGAAHENPPHRKRQIFAYEISFETTAGFATGTWKDEIALSNLITQGKNCSWMSFKFQVQISFHMFNNRVKSSTS
jgi:hypothetical protein